ncbi:hypothetical protein HYH02_001802 [Chlamydomonas schloesseri]|uniref:Uncharacterized protein n=1 Tax=Chlamydomonas schloesseri TaxID=2026947 RepID=A0A835WSV5_9CHLO|nr:hypothetical protein HYH02_001802 [Chlamydomonas schloesseri]|eukprot:KAG2453584.1 hypothetical protein HYH02_001802 [Chlamydomonas schloesseri]
MTAATAQPPAAAIARGSNSTSTSCSNGRAKVVAPGLTPGDRYEGAVDAHGQPHGLGTVWYGCGGRHEGRWRHGLRHGQGAYEAADGFAYLGTFVEDVAEGFGWARLANGGEYEGEWRAGRRHGWGLYVHRSAAAAAAAAAAAVQAAAAGSGPGSGVGNSSGRGADSTPGAAGAAAGGVMVYEGQWEDDRMHGLGRLLQAGEVFEGRYCRGRRVEGTWVAADGRTTYTGGFEGGERHGQGQLVEEGVRRYRGQWVRGVQEGAGQCQYADGSSYSGAWRAGAWHGLGEWRERGPPAALEAVGVLQGAAVAAAAAATPTAAPAAALAGEALVETGAQSPVGAAAAAAGVGRFLGGAGDQVDGAWYRGEFVEGRREGQGVARLANGDRYRGGWLAGRRHGRGEWVSAAGDRYVGEWAAGERHGQGSCVFANGDKYTGEWRHGQRHGYGEVVFADGVRFRGRWLEDCWVQSLADPLTSRVSGPGMRRAVAGQEARFVIEARDDMGNRRLCGGDCFRVLLRRPSPATLRSLALLPQPATAASAAATAAAALEDETAPGPVVAEGAVSDLDDGTYQVSYTCTAGGLLELHVLLLPPPAEELQQMLLPGAEGEEGPEGEARGDVLRHAAAAAALRGVQQHVGDSPLLLRVAAGPPHAPSSTVVGPGRHGAAAGAGGCWFAVQPRDRWGNQLTRGQMRLLVQQLQAQAQARQQQQQQQLGRRKQRQDHRQQQQKAQAATVAVRGGTDGAGAQLVGVAPLQVELSNGVTHVPLSLDASLLSVEGDGEQQQGPGGAAGSSSSRSGGSSSGAAAAAAEYRFTYTAPATPGLYRLQVVEAATGRHVGGSPFSVRFVPPAAAPGGATAATAATPKTAPDMSPGVADCRGPAQRLVASDSGSGGGPAGGAVSAGLAPAVVEAEAAVLPPRELQQQELQQQPVRDLVSEWGRRAEAALQEAEGPGEGDQEQVAGGGASGGAAADCGRGGSKAKVAAAAAAAAMAREAAAAGISDSERDYIAACASSVPVVADMADLWKVHQLQEERKAQQLVERLLAGAAASQGGAAAADSTAGIMH